MVTLVFSEETIRRNWETIRWYCSTYINCQYPVTYLWGCQLGLLPTNHKQHGPYMGVQLPPWHSHIHGSQHFPSQWHLLHQSLCQTPCATSPYPTNVLSRPWHINRPDQRTLPSYLLPMHPSTGHCHQNPPLLPANTLSWPPSPNSFPSSSLQKRMWSNAALTQHIYINHTDNPPTRTPFSTLNTIKTTHHHAPYNSFGNNTSGALLTNHPSRP